MSGEPSQRGFSLVELVVVVALAAIIGLIAVPKVSVLYAEYQLMSASGQLAFDVVRARMQAVGQNRFVHIKMLNSTQYACESSTDGSNWLNRVTTNLPKGVTSSTTSAEVRFDRRGFPTVNTSITVRNTISQTKTISTSLIGRVTVG
jgi:prepilin-type N-terminal cleavage/methylation domain-containing protein